ncbi:hypothetical protein FEM48_Zijuj09G0188300 [Ziziphus jujuba var. spinosa]|uniref:Reverse transcriptase RNase H-like domain-containing protein n=1 Tax=Ziziphus jujuba var. spinosa TaxID=714518 RepID=A0A978UUP8_ZIZJJ|nr:hypothetical protein FEM48_Zijuj09G0188300 [Ziziphus jujuba var. spinosa]
MVLQCLTENSFFTKGIKCQFFQSTIEYLRHLVSGKGVRADPPKVEAMISWPQPKNLKHKKLGMRLMGASTYLKELRAVVEAVAKWRQYLLVRHFIIRTDHKSLRELLTQVIQTPEQQKFLRKLMGYQFSIEYKAAAEAELSLYCQSTVAITLNSKLSHRYFGPFPIIAHARPLAYTLALPAERKIHPTFHVSLLKAFKWGIPHPCYPLLELSHANKPLLTPVVVLVGWIAQVQNKLQKQVMVQWSHSSLEDATWEDLYAFSQLYNVPDLEDKSLEMAKEEKAAVGMNNSPKHAASCFMERIGQYACLRISEPNNTLSNRHICMLTN